MSGKIGGKIGGKINEKIGGKGGMESKVRSAGMAMSFGIDTYIIDGKSPSGVCDIIEGQACGTHFKAHGRKIRSYQKWLAAGALNKGTLFIDEGAEKALLKNKKSLLAKGVTRVEGQFEIKDLLEICIFNFWVLGGWRFKQ